MRGAQSKCKRRVLPLLVFLLAAAVTAAGCGAEPPELRESFPWKDGELAVMDVKMNGELVAVYEISVREEGSDLDYTIEHLSTNYPQTRRVLQDPQTLQPRRTEFTTTQQDGSGTLLAEYGEDKVEIRQETPEGITEKSVRLPAPPYFDNEQFLLLARALPLAEGWQGSVTLIVTTTASRAPIGLEVTGRETVTVPAGTFDAYILELKRINQWAWVGTEPPYPVVKFENRNTGTVMELNEFFPRGRE